MRKRVKKHFKCVISVHRYKNKAWLESDLRVKWKRTCVVVFPLCWKHLFVLMMTQLTQSRDLQKPGGLLNACQYTNFLRERVSGLWIPLSSPWYHLLSGCHTFSHQCSQVFWALPTCCTSCFCSFFQNPLLAQPEGHDWNCHGFFSRPCCSGMCLKWHLSP